MSFAELSLPIIKNKTVIVRTPDQIFEYCRRPDLRLSIVVVDDNHVCMTMIKHKIINGVIVEPNSANNINIDAKMKKTLQLYEKFINFMLPGLFVLSARKSKFQSDQGASSYDLIIDRSTNGITKFNNRWKYKFKQIHKNIIVWAPYNNMNTVVFYEACDFDTCRQLNANSCRQCHLKLSRVYSAQELDLCQLCTYRCLSNIHSRASSNLNWYNKLNTDVISYGTIIRMNSYCVIIDDIIYTSVANDPFTRQFDKVICVSQINFSSI